MEEFENVPFHIPVHRSMTQQDREAFTSMIRYEIQGLIMTMMENWKTMEGTKKEIVELEEQWALPAHEQK